MNKVPRLKGEPTTLREALLRDYSVTQPTPKFLKAIAQRADAAPTLHYLLAPDRKQDLQTYLWGMEVIDFLVEHPSVRFRPEEFVGLLSKLQPRLYSVASSLKAFPDQVHLIVDVVRYESNGRMRKGVASSFLAERADEVPVPVFPSNAKHFHLPENPDTPIIMVGPGTGIAPFRAYLQERQVTGAKGKNWLFFGAQHEKCDFAYEEDFDAFMKEGILTRLDCAWSRDQAQKIYVQTQDGGTTRPRSGNGSMPRARSFSCAVMRAAWPRTWMRPCARLSRSRAARASIKRTSTSRS